MAERLSDFAAERAKHLVFFERKDLFQHIDHLLCEGAPWIVVAGSPGSGKTAILANYLLRLETAGMGGYLGWIRSWVAGGTSAKSPLADLAAHLYTVKGADGQRAVPHHFIKYGYKDWAVPSAIEQSLLGQLGLLFPKLIDGNDRSHDRLPNLLRRVAGDVLEPEHKRLVLFADGLDQIEGDFKTSAIFDLLPAELPDGISVVCSTRPVHGELAPLDWVSPVKIDLDSAEWAESNDAVRHACLTAHAKTTGKTADYAARVLQDADGNLRFLVECAFRPNVNIRNDAS